MVVWEEWTMGSYCLMGPKFQLAGMKTFWKWIVMMVAHCECTECHWIVYLKMVRMLNFMLCIFYHNKKINKKADLRLFYLYLIYYSTMPSSWCLDLVQRTFSSVHSDSNVKLWWSHKKHTEHLASSQYYLRKSFTSLSSPNALLKTNFKWARLNKNPYCK